jgi:outer membrane biosynthesis protein TonB
VATPFRTATIDAGANQRLNACMNKLMTATFIVLLVAFLGAQTPPTQKPPAQAPATQAAPQTPPKPVVPPPAQTPQTAPKPAHRPRPPVVRPPRCS